MEFNAKIHLLLENDYYIIKREHRINNPISGANLGKIFLLGVEVAPERVEVFYDGEVDDSILNRTSLKTFKKRRV